VCTEGHYIYYRKERDFFCFEREMCCGLFYNILLTETIQGASGGMVSILGSDISHCGRKSS